MPFKSGRLAPNEIKWTEKMISFLKNNYSKKTNQELSEGLGLKITTVRTKLYSLGCKRMELEYWTREQVRFLKQKYKKIGDVELSEMFNEKFPKKKKWTLKHIEKKRKYLKLMRTKKQVKAIKKRNIDLGRFKMCPVRAWDKRGRPPEGDIRYWLHAGRYIPFIKVNGKFVHWARHTWEKKFGFIPKGMNIVFKDNKISLSEDSLEMISDAELARRNAQVASAGLSDNWVAAMMSHKNRALREELKKQPEILELKRTQLRLKQTIRKYEKNK